MPITLTVGTNTYISAADAETYFGTRLYADAWTDASADDKAKALIMATRTIDRQIFVGSKAGADQPLEFPRCLPDKEGWRCEANVPQAVLDATCEEALALLTSGNDPRRVMQRAGVKSYSLGSLSETFADGALAGSTAKRGLISDEAKALLRPYLAGAVFTT